MKLIVGLGNPGREYEATPHNVGFRAADSICATLGAEWKNEPRHKAHVARVASAGQTMLLAKPQTFMNLSGEAVRSLASFYKIVPSDVVVLVDDVNIAPGRIRIRPSGGAGGHNGLKSITSCLGTDSYTRVRIGVGMGHHPVGDLADRVLGKIEAEDEAPVASGISLAAEAALCCASSGSAFAMNRYNGPETVETQRKHTSEKQI